MLTLTRCKWFALWSRRMCPLRPGRRRSSCILAAIIWCSALARYNAFGERFRIQAERKGKRYVTFNVQRDKISNNDQEL